MTILPIHGVRFWIPTAWTTWVIDGRRYERRGPLVVCVERAGRWLRAIDAYEARA